MAKKAKTKYTSIGGQALIEGIMMKGPSRTALSCRLPDGSIKTEKHNSNSLRNKNKFFRIPIIRGIVGFIDSLSEGYKTLAVSAKNAGIDLEDEELSPFEKKLMNFFGDKIYTVITTIAAVLGVILAVVLFMYVPILLFNGLQWLVNFIAGQPVHIENFRALFEGIVKIIIFVTYVAIVSKMKEIERVFQYHGAEHKTIFCYEAKLPLTVENVKKQSRFHPRCGTSFLIVMLLVSILVYFLLSFFFKALTENSWLWLCIKLLMMPIIMGLGYEFIRYAGKHDNFITRVLSAPGLWMQRLTTKEPDAKQIEVAIAALNAVDPLQPDPFTESNFFITGAPEKQPEQAEAQAEDTVVAEGEAQADAVVEDTAVAENDMPSAEDEAAPDNNAAVQAAQQDNNNSDAD